MARFSIGEAIGAAFSLIRRRPAAVFVWGLLVVGPILLFAPMMLAFIFRFAATIEAESAAGIDPATAPFPAEAFAGMVGMQAAAGLMNLLQLFALIVVYPAIMRAVIRPDERSWFSLRVGMDEVRVAVVAVAVFGGLYFVMMIGMMLAMVVAAVGAGVGGGPDGGGFVFGVVMMGLMVVMMIAALCVLARVSLMAPASLQYRTFAFAEGWRMGRGQWDRLIGLHLASIAVILMIELLLMILVLIIALVIMNMGVDWSWPQAGSSENPFPAIEAALVTWWPLMAAAGLLACAFYGVVLTISVAPVASACAQLARQDEINSLTG